MTYDPLFESVPAVTTTLHTASAGDQVVLANQTAMGFDIQVLNGCDRAIELFAAAATGNWSLIATAAPDLDTPVVTGLMTVEGVKVASGLVSGTLTMAAHGGGIFLMDGNTVCPNEAGFGVTLIATGAFTVRVATGATRAMVAGDMFTLAIPVVGTARAVHTLAADVITMAVS